MFTMICTPAPTLSIVSPLSGPVGTQMTIQGKDFSKEADENKVLINGTQIPVLAASVSELTLKLPSGISSGKVEVIVNDQKTVGPEFKNQSLGITKMTPDNGLAGTEVTIEGTGFSTNIADNKVLFNGIVAEVKAVTENSLTVVAPEGLKTGVLKIETGGMTAQAPKNFNRAGVMTLNKTGLGLSSSINRIAVDSHKNVYVTESSVIYKITQEGEVSLFSGKGVGATYTSITGIAIDSKDNLYVADKAIKKISTNGSSTIVNTPGITAFGNIVFDKNDNLYITSSYYGIFRIENGSGNVSKASPQNADDACRPAIDSNGTIYYGIAETFINRYNPYTYRWLGSDWGYQDGPFSSALFSIMYALVLDNDQNLMILDAFNYAIRKADFSSQSVTSIGAGEYGYEDGSLTQAKWGTAYDMAIDKDGDIYIVDPDNRAVRKVFLK